MHEAAVMALMALLLVRTLVPRRPLAMPSVTAPVVGVELVPRVDGAAAGTEVRMAVVVNGTAMVETVTVPGATITTDTLAATISQLLFKVGIAVPTKRRVGRVFLVAMNGKAVLARIDRPTRAARIRQVGADIHHADFAPVGVGEVRLALSLIDLSAFFLDYDTEEVSRFINFPSVEQVVRHLSTMLDVPAATRLAHEGRVVAVVALAFHQFRERLLSRWGVDPLRNRTLASLAGRIFITHFARTGPAPWKLRKTVKKRRSSEGFRDERRNEKVFAGNRDVRLAAARALWGGMMIAFRRGLLVESLVELDAVSLYPHAAIIQPLPHHRTRWRPLRDLAEVDRVEGFVHVEFEFPPGFDYPNLPTVREGVNRMLFTRRGVSTCTVAELRVALRFGATTRILDSHVFEPGASERQHDLARYMRELLADKAAAAKGSIPYETSKLLANALIGKLAERFGGSSLLDFERAAQLQGFSAGLGAAVAGSSALHQALQRTTDAGSLFAPEWAALIIGRGRAIIGDICAAGRAVLVSTDAVLVAPAADISCPGLAELRAAGSDMRLEHAADAAFIVRNRCYALLRRPQNVTTGPQVIAADGTWAVIRTARHGSSETPEEFAGTILTCLAGETDAAPERVRTRRLGAHEAVRRGRAINEEVAEPHRTTFNWDSKRRLLNRDVNFFTGFTGTVPYDTIGAMESGERQALKARRKAERRDAQRQAKLLRTVTRLLADGRTVGNVAEVTGVSISTVEQVLATMPVAEGEDG